MPVRPRRSLALRRAFSLIEAVIGLAILTILSGGIIATALFIRRSAEEVVYHNTALTLAQAYMEQLRSIEYGLLSAAAQTTGTPINLIGSNGVYLTREDGGVFSNGTWARETVMLDETPDGTPRQPMTIRLRPVLVDLPGVTANAARGVEIILHYETTYNFGFVGTHRGSLRNVRSNVPTY